MGTAEAFGANKIQLKNNDWYSSLAANENAAVFNKIANLQDFILGRVSAQNGSVQTICPECIFIGVEVSATKGAFQIGRAVTVDAGEIVIKDISGNVIPTWPRVYSGVELDIRLPEPAAGADYSPKMLKAGTENNVWSHWVGYQAELNMANDIVKIPNQIVISYGDKIGLNGADAVSVDSVTGNVTMWDAKFRSNSINMGDSPTFAVESNRVAALRKAIGDIENSNLPQVVKDKAIQNLSDGNFATNTFASGKAKNSVATKYCGGKPC